MTERAIVLIADPDVEVIKRLKPALERDYEVIAAKDGSKALELCILRHPALVLFDRRCPLLGATQFLRIVRSNPRTENIPVVVLSDTPLSGSVPGVLSGVLIKPLNVDEVRSHVAAVLRKVEAVQSRDADGGAVTGSLDQISMIDLLQIFSVNRRSGSLQISHAQGERPGDRAGAEVFLREGRIEEAITGQAKGEKALYRVLGWTSGRFAFLPGRRPPSVTISGSTDSLLMEGLRQGDELERVRAELPPSSARLERLVPVDGVPEGLHPVTAEIVSLVELYPRVGDLVDRARATDLEVYLALRSLIQSKLLRAMESEESPAERALVSTDDLFQLRTRLRHAGLAHAFLTRPKVAVVAPEPSDLHALVVGLSQLEGFESHSLGQVTQQGFGDIGQLALGDAVSVDFYAAPLESRMLPFFFGISAGTAGALVVRAEGGDAARVVRLLEEERKASSLVVRRPGEPPLNLHDDSRKVSIEVPDLSPASCRTFVSALVTQVLGRDDLRGVEL